jgi:hypothetical protein
MKTQKKKKYVKPEVTEIKLDAKCAVLGFCKISGDNGPNGDGACGSPLACEAHGS